MTKDELPKDNEYVTDFGAECWNYIFGQGQYHDKDND